MREKQMHKPQWKRRAHKKRERAGAEERLTVVAALKYGL